MFLQGVRKNLDAIQQINKLANSNEWIEQWRQKWIENISIFSLEMGNKLKDCQSNDELRDLFRQDLSMLLLAGCQRRDMINKWCVDRCNEIQSDPNGYLDLWSRDHYKSTIITFGKSIQDILITHGDDSIGDECTIGIFSYTRSLAQGFLDQIKRELEDNEILKSLFSDVLYMEPAKESPRWSSQMGLIVKRQSNPKESTVEAWGLVEGQPTSKHFSICVYDDIITHDTVKTMYLTSVATKSWENSLSLCNKDGVRRHIGTRKNFADTYSLILEREAATPRLYTPFDENEEPVLLSRESLTNLRRSQGEATFMCEYMQQPLKDSALGFSVDNLMRHQITDVSKLNLFIFCDPATSKKKNSDYTAMLVIGLDPESNIIVVDGVRDRLNPSERWKALYSLYIQYPDVKKVYYEEVGMNNDLFYFKEKMNEIGHFFDNKFENLKPIGNKNDRIGRLEPFINNKKLFLPEKLPKMSISGSSYDLVEALVREEIAKFPFPKHDDLLDCLAYCVQRIDAGEIGSIKKDDSMKNLMNVLEGNNRNGLFFRKANGPFSQ